VQVVQQVQFRNIMVSKVLSVAVVIVSSTLFGCGSRDDPPDVIVTCEDKTGQAITEIVCDNTVGNCQCEESWKKRNIWAQHSECAEEERAGEEDVGDKCTSCQIKVLTNFDDTTNAAINQVDESVLKGMTPECQKSSKIVAVWDAVAECNDAAKADPITARNSACEGTGEGLATSTCWDKFFTYAYPKLTRGCTTQTKNDPRSGYGYDCGCDSSYSNLMAYKAGGECFESVIAQKQTDLDNTCTSCMQFAVQEEDKFDRCYDVNTCTSFCVNARADYTAVYEKGEKECKSESFFAKFVKQFRDERYNICAIKFSVELI